MISIEVIVTYLAFSFITVDRYCDFTTAQWYYVLLNSEWKGSCTLLPYSNATIFSQNCVKVTSATLDRNITSSLWYFLLQLPQNLHLWVMSGRKILVTADTRDMQGIHLCGLRLLRFWNCLLAWYNVFYNLESSKI